MLVSVCMVIRDEAWVLSRTLGGVASYADEIIVGDTGSTDDSRDIAERAGARVLHLPAERLDYSAWRNATVRAAQGQWVLVLDADTEIDPHSRLSFRRLLEGLAADAARVHYHDYTARGWRYRSALRLFRTGKGLKFAGRLHESVSPSLRERQGRVVQLPVVINHLDVLRPAPGVASKAQRYDRLLSERSVRDGIRDWEVYAAELRWRQGDTAGAIQLLAGLTDRLVENISGPLNLGRLLRSAGEVDAATSYYELARIRAAGRVGDGDPGTRALLAQALNGEGMCLGELGRLDDAEACFTEAARFLPGACHIVLNGAWISARRGEEETARQKLALARESCSTLEDVPEWLGQQSPSTTSVSDVEEEAVAMCGWALKSDGR